MESSRSGTDPPMPPALSCARTGAGFGRWALKTIADIYMTLQKEKAPTQISLINTRLMLETGIDLKCIKPEQDGDPAAVNRVRTFLSELGVAA